MTWPPIIRVFFAISFEPPIQDALHQVLHVIKKNTKPGQIRWTRIENLHITLKFLPTLNIQDLPALESEILPVLTKYQTPLTLKVGQCITFPFFFRPRIIAMEIEPVALLMPLASELTDICNALQLTQRDSKPFRPHITLGRIKHPKNILLENLLSVTLPPVPPIHVSKLTLFQSDPTSEGTHHYTVIKHFPLG